MSKKLLVRISLAVLIVLFFSISALMGLFTDYLWFDALGFSQIFMISLFAKIKLFIVSGLIFFLFAVANLW
ncbi:MAG: UPF0182 family protein, partial [Nanoarchaeota archaeon]|nr:UPF0182 family protein [Nanoarchaeota archaeon]